MAVVWSLMENECDSKSSPKPIIPAPHKKAPLEGVNVGKKKKNRLDLIALDALFQPKCEETIKDAI